MIRVVGKDPEEIHRASCKNCASMLEFTLGEVNERTVHDYGGGAERIRYVHCPSCQQAVHLK